MASRFVLQSADRGSIFYLFLAARLQLLHIFGFNSGDAIFDLSLFDLVMIMPWFLRVCPKSSCWIA